MKTLNMFAGPQALLRGLIYVIVGISALWQTLQWVRAASLDEPRAGAGAPALMP
jgi:uncharacterized membrane protein YuzA (DUF378 family)